MKLVDRQINLSFSALTGTLRGTLVFNIDLMLCQAYFKEKNRDLINLYARIYTTFREDVEW